jgi:hypothetical protein
MEDHHVPDWLVERIVDKVMADRVKQHEKLIQNPTWNRLFGDMDVGADRERLMIRGRVRRILRYAQELGIEIPNSAT